MTTSTTTTKRKFGNSDVLKSFTALTRDLSNIDAGDVTGFTHLLTNTINNIWGDDIAQCYDTNLKIDGKTYDVQFHNKKLLNALTAIFNKDEDDVIQVLNDQAADDLEDFIEQAKAEPAKTNPSNVVSIQTRQAVEQPAAVEEGYDEDTVSVFEHDVTWVDQDFAMPVAVNYVQYKAAKDESSAPRPLPTAENLFCLLRAYGVDVRRNEMTLNVDVKIKNRKASAAYRNMYTNAVTIDNAVRNLATINYLPKDFVADALVNIMSARSYNPVREYFDGLEWDGKDYLGMLLDTLPSADGFDREFGRRLFEKNLVAGVAVEYTEKTPIVGAIVLTGRQGVGKSRFVERLAPPLADSFKGGLTPDFNNKDHMLTLLSCKVAEIAEATATTGKSSMEILKAVLTAHTHYIRAPYAAREMQVARKSLWFMTSNDRALLSDPSGNRRLWIWELGDNSGPITDPVAEYNVNGLWAQMVHLYKSGAVTTYLTDEENAKVNEMSADYVVIDPIHDLVAELYKGQVTVTNLGKAVIREGVKTAARTRTDIAKLLGIDASKVSDMKRLSAALDKLFDKSPKKSGGSVAYIVPKNTIGSMGTVLTDAEVDELANV